jgi:hypothetical protein
MLEANILRLFMAKVWDISNSSSLNGIPDPVKMYTYNTISKP